MTWVEAFEATIILGGGAIVVIAIVSMVMTSWYEVITSKDASGADVLVVLITGGMTIISFIATIVWGLSNLW